MMDLFATRYTSSWLRTNQVYKPSYSTKRKYTPNRTLRRWWWRIKNLKVFLQINALVDWWSDQKLNDRERENILLIRVAIWTSVKLLLPFRRQTGCLRLRNGTYKIHQKRIYTQGRTGARWRHWRRLRRWTVYEWRLRWRQTGWDL